LATAILADEEEIGEADGIAAFDAPATVGKEVVILVAILTEEGLGRRVGVGVGLKVGVVVFVFETEELTEGVDVAEGLGVGEGVGVGVGVGVRVGVGEGVGKSTASVASLDQV